MKSKSKTYETVVDFMLIALLRLFVFVLRILIKFNVNHTVDAEEDFAEEDSDRELEQGQSKQEPPKMQSKPNFEVDIVKGDTTLSLTCSYLTTPPSEGEYGK